MEGMTPAGLLEALGTAGIRLRIKDGFLECRGVKASYTDSIRINLASHRHNLIEDWRCLSCGTIIGVLFGFHPIVLCISCAHVEVTTERAVVRRQRSSECPCGEIGDAPTCPGCGGVAPHPPSLPHDGEGWWCGGCLNHRIWERAS